MVCVLCVQGIAEWQGEMRLPSTSEERRRQLQGMVQRREGDIQLCKQQIASIEAEIEKQSKPSMLPHMGIHIVSRICGNSNTIL